jgi:hypothetical protein
VYGLAASEKLDFAIVLRYLRGRLAPRDSAAQAIKPARAAERESRAESTKLQKARPVVARATRIEAVSSETSAPVKAAPEVTASATRVEQAPDTRNGVLDVSTADPRAIPLLSKNIYRELRTRGFSERDVMALAGELLGLVTTEVREERDRQKSTSRPPWG